MLSWTSCTGLDDLCMCTLPADYIGLEATLDSYWLFGTVAAKVCVVGTYITIFVFLYYLVSTYGLITDCMSNKKNNTYKEIKTQLTPGSLGNLYPYSLTHKAVVFLQFEDLADVFDAARREFLIVFTHLICGVREHQVPAFTSTGTKIPTVWVFIMLKQKQYHKLTWREQILILITIVFMLMTDRKLNPLYCWSQLVIHHCRQCFQQKIFIVAFVRHRKQQTNVGFHTRNMKDMKTDCSLWFIWICEMFSGCQIMLNTRPVSGLKMNTNTCWENIHWCGFSASVVNSFDECNEC